MQLKIIIKYEGLSYCSSASNLYSFIMVSLIASVALTGLPIGYSVNVQKGIPIGIRFPYEIWTNSWSNKTSHRLTISPIHYKVYVLLISG